MVRRKKNKESAFSWPLPWPRSRQGKRGWKGTVVLSKLARKKVFSRSPWKLRRHILPAGDGSKRLGHINHKGKKCEKHDRKLGLSNPALWGRRSYPRLITPPGKKKKPVVTQRKEGKGRTPEESRRQALRVETSVLLSRTGTNRGARGRKKRGKSRINNYQGNSVWLMV